MILDREVDPVKILQEVEAHRITHAIYVPAVLQFLQIVPNAHDHDLSSMQLVAYGASPITEQVLRDAMAQFSTAKFVQVYGLTETTGAVVQLDAADHDPENRPELLRSAGKPYPWVELRVVGADGEDVAPGEIGEIWIKGVQVMVGYWNNPEETARAITADGWFRSGDAGYLDEEGYLFLHDRVKDMIVSGRRERVPGRGRERGDGLPRRRRRRGDRRARREVGRGGEGHRREAGRRRGHRRTRSSPGPASASPGSRCPRASTSSTSCPATPPARS